MATGIMPSSKKIVGRVHHPRANLKTNEVPAIGQGAHADQLRYRVSMRQLKGQMAKNTRSFGEENVSKNAPARVSAIYRYPVKGLSPEAMHSVTVRAGETLPFDRAYAIENGQGRFDPQHPRHLPKVNFLMLMRNERMATLSTRFDPDTHHLDIERDGKTVARGQLSTPSGRAIIAQFLSAYFTGDLRGPPKIVSAPNHSFSDVAEKCLHIINLASLRDLERVAGTPLDPLRFRPNLIIDTGTPWKEFDWVGHSLVIGSVALKCLKRTERCAAINVDPTSGQRDMDLPVHLARNWGHTDFGVYASIVTDGALTVGAAVHDYREPR